MVQIVYEYSETWSEDGMLKVKVPPLEGEINVTPDSARRRANGYLARYVALATEAGEPVLVWKERPVWRLPIYLHLSGVGQAAKLGQIDVDARTREAIPLTAEQITSIQAQADEIVIRLTPAAAARRKPDSPGH